MLEPIFVKHGDLMNKYSKFLCLLLAILLCICNSDILTEPVSHVTQEGSNCKFINGVPFYTQVGLLPTGCELVSTKMALEYLNSEEVSIDTIVENTVCVDIKYDDGFYYAPSPNDAFIGDPYDEHGFGCYPPVIVNTCNQLLYNYKAVDTTGESIESLCKESIDNDMPVLLWVTIELQKTFKGDEWYLIDNDGTITDTKFTWIRPEHCLVLIGYDKDYYYCSDPLMKSSIIEYEKELIEQRFTEMGKKSVSFIISS